MGAGKFEDYINGIDVSNLQGDIDWQKVKQAGYTFAYIKSSQYSRIRDNLFDQNVSRAKAAGLIVGAYHACSVAHGPGNMTNPMAQMRFFYDASEGLGSNPGELPPMLDWEVNTANAPELAVTWLLEALEEATYLWYPGNVKAILQGGKERLPVVYTYPVFAHQHQPFLILSPELRKHPLCLASYKHQNGDYHPSQDGRTEPFVTVPKPWPKATFWQHTGNGGKVPGVPAHCDKQVFLGSSGELDELCGIERPVHRSEWNDK